MGLIFKKEATLKQKIIGIVFIFTLCIALYGSLANFLVSDSFYSKLLICSYVISVILSVSFFALLFNPKNSAHVPTHYLRKTKWFYLVGTPILIALFSIMAIAKGYPAIIHHFLANNDHITITVLEKTSSKSCRYGLRIAEYEHLFNDKVCGLNKSEWAQLKANDKLILTGKSSIIGFSYSL